MSKINRINAFKPPGSANESRCFHRSANAGNFLTSTRAKSIFRRSYIFAALSGSLLSGSAFAASDLIIDGGRASTSSLWNITDALVVGDTTSGLLEIEDGGVVNSASGLIGGQTGSTGVVNLSGTGSQWNNRHALVVGNFGNGSLTISGGGVVNSSTGYIGHNASATGIAEVSGRGSQWNNNGNFAVGFYGNAELTISDGGVVNSKASAIGVDAGSSGVALVSGVGSQLNSNGHLYVGLEGNGKLNILNGGTVSAGNYYSSIAYTASSTGQATVSGAGSQWNDSDELTVGYYGDGSLTISDGGVVNSAMGYIAHHEGSSGVVNVSGVGSQWNSGSALHVGYRGYSDLKISDGGVVNSDTGSIAYNAGSIGMVTLSGAGSQWNNNLDLTVGHSGNAFLVITDGAEVSAGSVYLANDSGSIGVVSIGNRGLAGTLNAANLTGGDGAASVQFIHTDDIDFSVRMSGALSVRQIAEGTTTLTSANDYAGTTTVMGGTLQAGIAGAFSPASDFLVQTAGQLNLAGYDQTVASLNNAGTVSFNGAPGTVLTVSGDYTGNNGLLNFNTVLNDDSSATDKLVVAGNTSGTTRVSVTNAGGGGAATLNGIELVQVNGTSDGEFVQQGRIVAGAYDYTLTRGAGVNAGSWYLTSVATPLAPLKLIATDSDPNQNVTPSPDPVQNVLPMVERPEAGSYTSNLAAANSLFVTRLHDRLGETQYIDALTGEQKVTSMWLRNEGGHTKSRDANGQLDTQANRYVMQLGGDIAQWSSNDQNRLHLGVMAGYANSKSHTESRWSGYSSRGTVDGYSAGLYATWYANEADKSGLYVDSWALYNWFNNRVDGQYLDSEEYKSNGVTASVESGYTFKLGENSAKNVSYFIQPKAQVIWMGVKADDHTEANGTKVSGEGDGNIQTRLGVRVFMNGYSEQDKGKDRVFQPFVEANWIHNTKDFGTTMDGATMKQDGAANIGELKVGVEGQINKRLNLWGNVGQQLGNNSYSDTAVMFGVKYNF
ncbi:autotransporter outer membrane beta-barrel domain-containing protein [Budvicia diplopodorum]|uniref:autotransporter outer membrane beta-barrel domain-containing protein n=1 Tax=Budvicia diplopodorum TaxID=1119056 RepID=UPI001FEC9FE6|nr:autotransporter outer membrane beta-barrel domain-containing protein [Budvicia diplopodorum]